MINKGQKIRPRKNKKKNTEDDIRKRNSATPNSNLKRLLR